MNEQQKEAISTIVGLGRQHRTAIREAGTLTNMLKSRARIYTGYENLLPDRGMANSDDDSGENAGREFLDKAKVKECYQRLIVDQEDPLFVQAAEDLFIISKSTKQKQDQLARQMGKVAQTLPIWKWAEAQHGFGAPMLAKIIAEAGRDLADYTTPAKLWKRFGLAVVDGKAPKPVKGKALGYSQYRRSVAFQMGDSLIKAGKAPDSMWYRLYSWRKKYEIEAAKDLGMVVLPAAQMKESKKGSGIWVSKKTGELARSEGHIHSRAKRYMEKKFLERIWEEWTEDRRSSTLPEFITNSMDKAA